MQFTILPLGIQCIIVSKFIAEEKTSDPKCEKLNQLNQSIELFYWCANGLDLSTVQAAWNHCTQYIQVLLMKQAEVNRISSNCLASTMKTQWLNWWNFPFLNSIIKVIIKVYML